MIRNRTRAKAAAELLTGFGYVTPVVAHPGRGPGIRRARAAGMRRARAQRIKQNRASKS